MRQTWNRGEAVTRNSYVRVEQMLCVPWDYYFYSWTIRNRLRSLLCLLSIHRNTTIWKLWHMLQRFCSGCVITKVWRKLTISETINMCLLPSTNMMYLASYRLQEDSGSHGSVTLVPKCTNTNSIITINNINMILISCAETQSNELQVHLLLFLYLCYLYFGQIFIVSIQCQHELAIQFCWLELF